MIGRGAVEPNPSEGTANRRSDEPDDTPIDTTRRREGKSAGAHALMRAVLSDMRGSKHGKVINISGGGATSSSPNFPTSACPKTALARAPWIVSDDVQDSGIASTVAPGR